MYESTMDGLVNLYDKVSKGGYIIIDDYGLPPCAEAVTDFRHQRNLTAPITKIDVVCIGEKSKRNFKLQEILFYLLFTSTHNRIQHSF